MLHVERSPERFLPRCERVLARYRPLEPVRAAELIQRVLALEPQHCEAAVEQTLSRYSWRHRQLLRIFQRHFEQVRTLLPPDRSEDSLSLKQKLLIGAYFTMEYSIEAAAFFNPSLVPAPDQSGLASDQLRVIFSFRAVGEGHVSSLVFREAMLTQGQLRPEPVGRFADPPESIRMMYPAASLQQLCDQAPLPPELQAQLMRLGLDDLSHAELLGWFHQLPQAEQATWRPQIEALDEGYELRFGDETDLSERVIFPMLEHERNGIEDARFVHFSRPDGSQTYYATYTAYDGRQIQPRLLHTEDFVSFRSYSLRGPGAVNKNLALFPRQLQGRYAMLSRIDGVNNYIMFSERLTHWEQPQLIQVPREIWEFGNLGNCGSPLETPAGWLVITHGVGPMREYALGAILLDRDDPRRLLARLREPLMLPQADEREGYVPNVVYACGSLLHRDQIQIAYGMADRFGGLARVSLSDLLARMTPEPD
ncbi:MAG: glycosidase [Candidatus Melainabacteria bacterium HGW-Melainabacteria-1]|nr:MAG: glycosidase [Candidatus Melainabacteria bacterium HGW-Melainabacteria-1]